MGILRPLVRKSFPAITMVGMVLYGTVASAQPAPPGEPSNPPPGPTAPESPPPALPAAEAPAPPNTAPPAFVPGPPTSPSMGGVPYPNPPPAQYAPVAPPGWGPPPPPGYQGVIPGTQLPIGALPHYMRPRRLKFDEDLPTPPGYHVEVGPNQRIMLAGGITFLSAYGISAIAAGGSIAEEETVLAPLFIPLAGPFIALGTTEVQFENGEQVGGILLILDGVAQVAGATLFIIGAAVDQRHLERDRVPGYASSHPEPQLEFIAKPGGASARLTF